jgi:high-affinity Fe2+/Pb2+ permease
LKKEFEIIIATSIGITLSFFMSFITFFLGDKAHTVLTEHNAELLSNYLLIFSGFFIVYVIFSLHKTFHVHRSVSILEAHVNLQQKTFDTSLFLTIIFLVMREGFEIALFTASTSLFSLYIQNIIGLFLGFMFASLIGITTFFAYIKFSIRKIFKVTEYMIILLGASLTQKGITELLEIYFNLRLSSIGSLSLFFLPDKESFGGHFLQTMIGIDREFSLGRLLIMALYIAIVYLLFLRKKQNPISNA